MTDELKERIFEEVEDDLIHTLYYYYDKYDKVSYEEMASAFIESCEKVIKTFFE